VQLFFRQPQELTQAASRVQEKLCEKKLPLCREEAALLQRPLEALATAQCVYTALFVLFADILRDVLRPIAQSILRCVP